MEGGGEASGEPPPADVSNSPIPPPAATDVPPPPPPPAEAEACEIKAAKLRRDAKSLLHRMTHLPKNPFCKVCNDVNIKAKPKKIRDPQIANAPRRFGDLILGDHLLMPSDVGSCGESAGLLLKDKGTGWRDLQATADKSAFESQRVMRNFAGGQKVSEFYSDQSNN